MFLPKLLLSLPNRFLTRPAENAQTGSRIDAVAFQVGMPALDLFPYKLWQQAGNQVLKNFKQAHLGYEDTLGYWNLRKAIAAYLRIARAVTCEAEQVIVVTGSQQGLNLVVECLLNKDDKVWMEDPGYHGARIAFYQCRRNTLPHTGGSRWAECSAWYSTFP